MARIAPADRVPLLAAVVVMLLGNVAGYLAGATVYLTYLAAPVAIGAFCGARYLLHGDPLPAAVRP
ncbi:hypothetical protein [Halosegnis sp.]|uniref:hypothetical protein n=1 Tax=Halosegnis sp. TaxID=2864959 RepID=UPI0035D42571